MSLSLPEVEDLGLPRLWYLYDLKFACVTIVLSHGHRTLRLGERDGRNFHGGVVS